MSMILVYEFYFFQFTQIHSLMISLRPHPHLQHMSRHNITFATRLLWLDVVGLPLGKPRSLPKDLQHLDRKCVIGNGPGNFAFPTSLGAREVPRKRCHHSRSSGELGSSSSSWTSSPRRESASCFFRLSFAGIDERSHRKTEINTEQGGCCFSMSVNGDRASPD